jgi:hypothetical protein
MTVRRKDPDVAISVEALKKLLPPAKPRQNLVAFLRELDLPDLDLTRECDTGRDLVL